jgi:O-antigen ligase
MEFDHSRHSRALLTGLLIFGFILPLSKSVSSVIMGLVYIYAFVMIILDGNFRATVVSRINQPLTVPIGIYVLIALLGLSFTEQLSEGINIVKQIVNLPLVYLMVSVSVDAEQSGAVRLKNAEGLFLSFLAGILVLDLIGLLTYCGLIGHARYVLPVDPLNMHHVWFGNLNALGVYTAASLLLFRSYGRHFAMRALLWYFIVLAAISILLSTARTAWFGMIFTSLVMFFFLIKNKKILVISGISLIAVCIAAYSFTDIIHQRINMIFSDISLFFSGVTHTSIGARFLMWKGALALFLSHPVFGVGTGDYKTALAGLVASGMLPSFVQKFNQPHNMYLFSLVTNGLIGFFALLFIFYRIFRYAKGLIRLSQKERLFGFLSMAVAVHYMTAGLAESLLNMHVLIGSFALISGICIRRTLSTPAPGPRP